MTARWTVEDRTIHTPARELLAADVREGFAADPPMLPPKWFYDETGSRLFDEITRLDEYYLTRAEEGILAKRAPEIAEVTGAQTLVELGSGTSAKTRLLLDAFTAGGRPLLFAPLDVSGEILADAAERIAAAYPTVTVEAVVADYDHHLPHLPGEPGEHLVAFLGSTIGNFMPDPRRAFLERLASALSPGDHVLMGADLRKDEARLLRAYDDSAGVTAAFNRNVLLVLNRELDGELDVDAFAHEARWNAAAGRVEMWLVATRETPIRLPAAGVDIVVPAGWRILTETSAKFDLDALPGELESVGLSTVRHWTDDAADFSLVLARA